MSNGTQAAAMNPIKIAALKAMLGDDFTKVEAVLGGAETIQMKADASGAAFKSAEGDGTTTTVAVAETPAPVTTPAKAEDKKPPEATVVTDQDYLGDLTIEEFGGLFNTLFTKAMSNSKPEVKVDFGDQLPVTAKSLEPLFTTMKTILDVAAGLEKRVIELEGGAPKGSATQLTTKSVEVGQGTQVPVPPVQQPQTVNPLVSFWAHGKVGTE